jgi:hypothetical protein
MFHVCKLSVPHPASRITFLYPHTDETMDTKVRIGIVAALLLAAAAQAASVNASGDFHLWLKCKVIELYINMTGVNITLPQCKDIVVDHALSPRICFIISLPMISVTFDNTDTVKGKIICYNHKLKSIEKECGQMKVKTLMGVKNLLVE